MTQQHSATTDTAEEANSASKVVYVAPFEHFGQDDGDLVGGKTANLGEMRRAEIPVPAGVGTTFKAWERFLEVNPGLWDKIVQLHVGLDVRDEPQRNERTAEMRSLIKAANMPEDVSTDIKQAYRKLSKDGHPPKVAVRSSGIKSEDLADASAAGNHDSILNVIGEDNVVAAVQACFASLFTSRAVWYRGTKGIELEGIGMGVAIQLMVQAQRSAIIFTAHKVTGNTNRMTMTIGYGLCENFVQGGNADYVTLDKDPLKILEHKIRKQETKLVWSEDQQRNIQQPIDPELQDVSKAPDYEILALAEVCLAAERHYGRYRDIEAANDGSGWQLVQSRDITIKTLGFVEEDEPFVDPSFLVVEGLAASAGVGVGVARVILEGDDNPVFEDGDIVLTKMTTPDMEDKMEVSPAVVAEDGTPNSHAAIVGGELEIAVVVGATNALQLMKPGEIYTVDGSHGKIYRGEIPELVAWNTRRDERLAELNAHMAGVKTATKVGLIASLPAAAQKLARRNADMICLQRAEFLVAKQKRHPRDFEAAGEREMFIQAIYDGVKAYCQAFKPRHDENPLMGWDVFRKLDFKTDEMMRLLGSARFEIPEKQFMLGKRGVFRYEWDAITDEMETEALIRVAREFDNLVVMFPFVRTPEELGRAIERAVKQGLNVPFWFMVETPITAYFLREFVQAGQGRIKGISIGSNDLLQGEMMVDREDDILAAHKEYSENHWLMRRLFRDIVRGGKELGLTVSLCGNAVSKFPEIAVDLVEENIDSIGVDVRKVDIVRQIIIETEDRLGRLPSQ